MILNVLYRTQVEKSSYFNTSDKKAFNFRQKYNVNFIDFFAVSFLFNIYQEICLQNHKTSHKTKTKHKFKAALEEDRSEGAQ